MFFQAGRLGARLFNELLETAMTDLNRRSALTLALAATAAAAAGNSASGQDDQTVGQRVPIEPASIEALRVYPPLGIARVGNAMEADAYVIGPEVICGPSTLPDGTPASLVDHFRTGSG